MRRWSSKSPSATHSQPRSADAVVRVCHTIQPVFDDPNLVAFGGLPAVMRLAEQAGLHDLVEQHVTMPGSAGSNAAVKVPALVAGMVAGADSISDMDVLRHGGMGRVFSLSL